MAWDEWEQLKADALARQQNQMRLDSAAGGGGGTGNAPDLKTNNAGKQAAVRALTVDIEPGTQKAGSHADEATSAAAREFSGWDTGSGLKDAQDEWGLQVKNLQARLAADKNSLDGSHQHLQYVDYGMKSDVAQVKVRPAPQGEA